MTYLAMRFGFFTLSDVLGPVTTATAIGRVQVRHHAVRDILTFCDVTVINYRTAAALFTVIQT